MEKIHDIKNLNNSKMSHLIRENESSVSSSRFQTEFYADQSSFFSSEDENEKKAGFDLKKYLTWQILKNRFRISSSE